ncbi:MAG: sulfite exporter TauE/SafE family protein [Chloroflexi bacterium]|nr:sulfite exporter TauE/SafE family protein [Chloroflexota bacterium]
MSTTKLPRRATAALATGTLDGLFSGLTGVGGGAILVPLLVSLLGLSQHKAHGTSLSVICMVGFIGFLEYSRQGYMDFTMAAGITVGSLVGVYFGAKTMNLVPAKQLRQAFAIFLIFVAIRMLFK